MDPGAESLLPPLERDGLLGALARAGRSSGGHQRAELALILRGIDAHVGEMRAIGGYSGRWYGVFRKSMYSRTGIPYASRDLDHTFLGLSSVACARPRRWLMGTGAFPGHGDDPHKAVRGVTEIVHHCPRDIAPASLR